MNDSTPARTGYTKGFQSRSLPVQTAPSAAPAPNNAPKESLPLAGTRVLIVDDSEDNQRIFRFFLEHAGASIEVIGDGASAVARLLRADLPQPNLVLMDIDMPEMDGCEATKRIRALGIKTPIVALTGHALSGDRTRCLAAGCNDHVAKPVDRTALVRLCGRWGAGHAAASHAA